LGTSNLDFYVYPASRPAQGNGEGPQFNLQVPVKPNVTYTVQIRALGVGGNEGPGSHFETFTWLAATQGSFGEAPWPARSIPTPGLYAGLFPVYAPTNYPGVTLLIGAINVNQTGPSPDEVQPSFKSGIQPADLLFTNVLGHALLPFVVYRFQVTNTFFPVVSGDISQVSPLMDGIALKPWEVTYPGSATVHHYQKVVDPFIVVPLGLLQKYPGGRAFPILIKDTQPVLRGAKYKYLFVRFGDNGEPVEVIPTPPVEIVP
jgi:hypothetical protein